MLRPLLRLASPPGGRARLSVLVLHRVLPAFDPMFPEALHRDSFDAMCHWLARDFSVLPLDGAVDRLRCGELPAAALAITFDDGYADNRQVAIPILQRHGLTATVFVTTGFLDGGCMWNDVIIEAVRRTSEREIDLGTIADPAPRQRLPLATPGQRRTAAERAIDLLKYLPVDRRREAAHGLAARLGVSPPTDLMLTAGQVRELRDGGMQLGGHTRTHPILATLDHEAMRAEVAGGRADLQDILQQPVRLFAYPNGRPQQDYDETAVRIVREAGFDAAFTTAKGAASTTSDMFQLPRFTPWDRTPLRFNLRMVANLWSTGQHAGA